VEPKGRSPHATGLYVKPLNSETVPENRKPDLLSSQYLYVRGLQLEGTYPADAGIWLITACRVQYGWGTVAETAWPRVKAGGWPPEEPPGLDALAKSLRIPFYQRARDLMECKRALAHPLPVCAAFDITDQWFNAPGGRIEFPGPADKIVGSHAVLLVGVNDDESQIRFVNSWGRGWGDNGLGWMPYAYFDKHFSSGWILYYSDVPDDVEYPYDISYVDLGYRSVLTKAVHVKQIYDVETDDRLGWAIGVERESHLDIEDFFVRPEHRGRGFGRELCNMVGTLSMDLNLPVRVWFSHADHAGPVQQNLCESLGLTIVPSGVPWAHAKAVCAHSTSADVNQSVPKPARPNRWRPKLE